MKFLKQSLIFFFCLIFIVPSFADDDYDGLSPDQEREITREFLKEVGANAVFLKDPLVENYFMGIINRLEKGGNLKRKINLIVIDDPRINAFAGPGGYIGIYTGLIEATKSESELAAVLAHELAHIKQQHLARLLATAKAESRPALIGTLAAIALGAVNPALGLGSLAAISAGYSQALINLMRVHEQEADNIGMKVLYQSNYLPQAMPVFFKRLQDYERYFSTDIPVYLRTHPMTTSRIADALNRARLYGVQSVQEDQLKFDLIKLRIEVTLADNPEKYLKEIDHKKLADVNRNFAIAMVKTRLKKYDDAIQILEKLPQDNQIIQQSLVHVYMQANQNQNALQILTPLYQKNSHDYALILQYCMLLTNNQNYLAAREILEDAVFEFPRKPALFFLLAEAQAKTNQRARSHISQAKQYLIIGNLGSALLQLKMVEHYKKQDPDAWLQAQELIKKVKQRN